jgi:hypothetical protein
MASKVKKFKWMTIRYDRGDLLPDDIDGKINGYLKEWGAPSSYSIPDEIRRNVKLTMREQVAGRGSYDWNAIVDLNDSTVQLPMVGFDEVDKTKRFVLDKQGLMLADDDSTESYSYEELVSHIKITVLKWIDISLLYSVGGVVDSIGL